MGSDLFHLPEEKHLHLSPLIFSGVQGGVIYVIHVWLWSSKTGQIKMLPFAFIILEESHLMKLRWCNDVFS